MNSRVLLIAVIIAVGIPSLSYLFSTRYTVVPLTNIPTVVVLDGWTGKSQMQIDE